MPSFKKIFDYPRYWAECFGTATFLPTSKEQMSDLGWDSCDVIIVTGDAYVDHPSFGMAIIGRLLEAQGFRVGIIAQPDWHDVKSFQILGKPNLYFGVAAGNMDSMINRYTADRLPRSDDAYTPNGLPDKRPDRASLVYAQRCQEAYQDVPIILGGIEASLRRVAHYDYWQDKVRRSILVDAKADMLIYGNAERAIVELTHRLANGEHIENIQDIRGTVFLRKTIPSDYTVINSTSVEQIDTIEPPQEYLDLAFRNPYETESLATNDCAKEAQNSPTSVKSQENVVNFPQFNPKKLNRDKTVIRLPSYDRVSQDPIRYAHASRVLHLETNPGNARALVQRHNDRELWLNPPAYPLSTEEMDYLFDRPFARTPHPMYEGAKIPAYEMIRFSVNIMRGCFGGCTFCSITEHEGRIIQNRSEDSILREIQTIRDQVPGFTGIISDLGGPTANMYRLACVSPEIEAACRRPSCVFPGICRNLNTDHRHLTTLYRKARQLKGIKKILIGSGLRYDLAVKDPEYVKELVQHHVGGYLKIAPEHTEAGPLSKMMKPGMGAYEEFKRLFDRFSKEAGKEQYLIPYFIAAHPGTTDEDMMNLALWLKRNNFRADQVQTFYPSTMATATAMYYSGKNPLRKVTKDSENVYVVKNTRDRKIHKAFLRYHDPKNWPLLRETLKNMGRADLIGNGKQHLIPIYQPRGQEDYRSPRRANSTVQTTKNSSGYRNNTGQSRPKTATQSTLLQTETAKRSPKKPNKNNKTQKFTTKNIY